MNYSGGTKRGASEAAEDQAKPDGGSIRRAARAFAEALSSNMPSYLSGWASDGLEGSDKFEKVKENTASITLEALSALLQSLRNIKTAGERLIDAVEADKASYYTQSVEAIIRHGALPELSKLSRLAMKALARLMTVALDYAEPDGVPQYNIESALIADLGNLNQAIAGLEKIERSEATRQSEDSANTSGLSAAAARDRASRLYGVPRDALDMVRTYGSAGATDWAKRAVFANTQLKLSTTLIPRPYSDDFVGTGPPLRAVPDGKIWGHILKKTLQLYYEVEDLVAAKPGVDPEALERQIENFALAGKRPEYVFPIGYGIVGYQEKILTRDGAFANFYIIKDEKLIFLFDHMVYGTVYRTPVAAHTGTSFHFISRMPDSTEHLNSVFVSSTADKTTVNHVRVLITDKDLKRNVVVTASAAGSMVLLHSWTYSREAGHVNTLCVLQVPNVGVSPENSAPVYTFDQVLLLKFQLIKTQAKPEFYSEERSNDNGGAVDAEGNVMFMLTHNAPAAQTDVFRLDAKTFEVRLVAELPSRELWHLTGGPGGQLLVTMVDRALTTRYDHDSASTLHELIPVSAPDDYTHFFQGDQIGADAVRAERVGLTQYAAAAAAAAAVAPMEE